MIEDGRELTVINRVTVERMASDVHVGDVYLDCSFSLKDVHLFIHITVLNGFISK